MFVRVIRHLAVNLSCVAVSLASFAILRAWTMPKFACGAVAFAAAFHHDVTWGARIAPNAKSGPRFYVQTVATLAANLAVVSALGWFGLTALAAQGVGIALVCLGQVAVLRRDSPTVGGRSPAGSPTWHSNESVADTPADTGSSGPSDAT